MSIALWWFTIEFPEQATPPTSDATDPVSVMLKDVAVRFPSMINAQVLKTPVKGLFAITDGTQVVYVNSALTVAFRGEMEVITPQRSTLFNEIGLEIASEPMHKAPDKQDTIKSEPLATRSQNDLTLPPAPPSKYAGLTKAAHTQALRNINFDHLIRFDHTATGSDIRRTSMLTFVDSSCPACKRLMHKIAELNSHGVTVFLAPFPRNGLNTNVGKQMLAAWCAGDNEVKKKAVLDLFAGRHMFNTCTDEELKQSFHDIYDFAESSLGGMTPVSFTDNGVTILANQNLSFFMEGIDFGYRFKEFSASTAKREGEGL
ncbi:thioredoxin fold domain-containing protein [Shewanella colwelliana]|uniref:thioredoxin fold domain-containing protein n=1 Tax=Shewanella colwelliana TaxID=23 RepID=UPI0022AF2879|nr:thioredoxin fold domain-containing protein [Shewanella colwelliana]MCZ4337705.1 thioredoxin fold domain-containing protein [Shewanella colwelliana]